MEIIEEKVTASAKRQRSTMNDTESAALPTHYPNKRQTLGASINEADRSPELDNVLAVSRLWHLHDRVSLDKQLKHFDAICERFYEKNESAKNTKKTLSLNFDEAGNISEDDIEKIASRAEFTAVLWNLFVSVNKQGCDTTSPVFKEHVKEKLTKCDWSEEQCLETLKRSYVREACSLESFINFYEAQKRYQGATPALSFQEEANRRTLYDIACLNRAKHTLTKLLDRDAAILEIFYFCREIFTGRFDCLGKVPMCLVYGAAGSGKTALFVRFIAQHSQLIERFNEFSDVKVCFHPDVCVPAAVSFGCCSHVNEREIEMIQRGCNDFNDEVLSVAIGMRLVFLWFVNISSWCDYVYLVRQFSERHSDWCKVFDVKHVVREILLSTQKQHVLLCVDETVKFTEIVKNMEMRTRAPTKTASTSARTDWFLRMLRSVVHGQLNGSYAIVFSTLDLEPFDMEVASSSACIPTKKLFLPLLNVQEVATELFPKLLENPDKVCAQLTCETPQFFQICARLSGGWPRAVTVIAHALRYGVYGVAQDYWEGAFSLILHKFSQRHSFAFTRVDPPQKELLWLLSPSYQLLVSQDRLNKLVRGGLLHEGSEGDHFIPHLLMYLFVDELRTSGWSKVPCFDFITAMVSSLFRPLGDGWEMMFAANCECLQALVRREENAKGIGPPNKAVPSVHWTLCSFKDCYGKATVFNVAHPLRRLCFDFTKLRTVKRCKDRHMDGYDHEKLLKHVWIPHSGIQQHTARYDAGFDFFLFQQVLNETGTVVDTTEEGVKLVLELVKYKLSAEDSATKLNWQEHMIDKRATALAFVKDKYNLTDERFDIIYRVAAWRSSSKETRPDDDDNIPENVIVCDKADLQEHLGPTLRHMLDAVIDIE